MEGLAQRKPSIMPQQEYLLQGSILESSRDVLIHRLQGLCDNIETGPETFRDHEMVFNMSVPPALPVLFRARRSLLYTDAPWHVRYIGQADLMADKSRPTLMRSCIDVSTSENLVQFLQEMGFKLDHEYVVQGALFVKGRMKVTVSKIYRMLQQGNVENTEPMTSSCLVELSVVTAAGQDSVQDDMKTFAEHLKPLVQLDKIDHRRLQNL